MIYAALIVMLILGCIATLALVIRDEGRKDGSM